MTIDEVTMIQEETVIVAETVMIGTMVICVQTVMRDTEIGMIIAGTAVIETKTTINGEMTTTVEEIENVASEMMMIATGRTAAPVAEIQIDGDEDHAVRIAVMNLISEAVEGRMFAGGKVARKGVKMLEKVMQTAKRMNEVNDRQAERPMPANDAVRLILITVEAHHRAKLSNEATQTLIVTACRTVESGNGSTDVRVKVTALMLTPTKTGVGGRLLSGRSDIIITTDAVDTALLPTINQRDKRKKTLSSPLSTLPTKHKRKKRPVTHPARELHNHLYAFCISLELASCGTD